MSKSYKELKESERLESLRKPLRLTPHGERALDEEIEEARKEEESAKRQLKEMHTELKENLKKLLNEAILSEEASIKRWDKIVNHTGYLGVTYEWQKVFSNSKAEQEKHLSFLRDFLRLIERGEYKG